MKFIVTCPGCSNRTTIENQSAMGRRATCKKCGAGFLIDGTVATQVCNTERELLERIELELQAKEPSESIIEEEIIAPNPRRKREAWVHFVYAFVFLVLAGWYLSNIPLLNRRVSNEVEPIVAIDPNADPVLNP